MISHDRKDCDVWLARKDTEKTMPYEYGPWLRAMPFNPGKTPLTVVSGMGDELEGAKKSSNKSTETTIRSSEMNTTRPDPKEKEGVDRMQHPDMETSETEALLMQKSQKISTPLYEVIDPKSILSSCHINFIDFDV